MFRVAETLDGVHLVDSHEGKQDSPRISSIRGSYKIRDVNLDDLTGLLGTRAEHEWNFEEIK